jgi:hypothetical protein
MDRCYLVTFPEDTATRNSASVLLVAVMDYFWNDKQQHPQQGGKHSLWWSVADKGHWHAMHPNGWRLGGRTEEQNRRRQRQEGHRGDEGMAWSAKTVFPQSMVLQRYFAMPLSWV